MKQQFLSLGVLVLFFTALLGAQRVDDTQLKQVILFGRHGVRTPVVPNSVLDSFSSQPYPAFSVSGVSNLTVNGAINATIMGSYYRLWLTKQGLLTGKDSADAAFVYFRATGTPLIAGTAKAFAAGMLPEAAVNVNTYTAPASDPLFDPIDAGVAQLDLRMAVAAVQGRLGGNPQSLASVYAPELALVRSVLFGYALDQTPVPETPPGKLDVSALPISITTGTTTTPVTPGGLADVLYAIDPFAMEYADGMPASDVGWGQLNGGSINQITRLYNLLLDLEYRTPYLARVQSSNMASHIVRSLVQGATGNGMTGTVGSPSSKVVVLVGSNTNMTGLAGLLHLDWVLPGYPPDSCAPGGILSFELRQSQSTGEYVVRVSYVTQTMDQLRNRTPLTLTAPPAIAPVFVPGCSKRNATFDCSLEDFVTVLRHAVDPLAVDLTN